MNLVRSLNNQDSNVQDSSLNYKVKNKQLVDEAECDIKNYPDRGQCYLPKPKAEADNFDQGLDNS